MTKKLTLMTAILGVFFSFHLAFAKDFLSPKQKKDVLNSIDDIAGDSWDEGDSFYQFFFIRCSDQTRSCVVLYRQRAQYPRLGAWSKAKRCYFHNVRSYKEILDVSYDTMDGCISGTCALRSCWR